MPGLKDSQAEQAAYLLDALRHIEAVAHTAVEVAQQGIPHIFSVGGCSRIPEMLPRPFGRWCGGLTDLGRGPGGKTVAGRRAPKARRSRKQVKR